MSTNIPESARVHTSILLLSPSSKLWYLCRALDEQGEGKVTLTPQRLQLLNEAKSTIYRWLREGRELGLFRRYRWEGNTLKIMLGGLIKACKRSKISKFGTVTESVSLAELLDGNRRRVIASAITTQDLQERSRYAAKKQLNKLERRCFDVPTADQLLNSQTSPKLTSGGTRGVIHVGSSRLFVGRSFIPFGVSQSRVSEELNSQPHSCGVSSRTLRRHLQNLAVTKRQIVQARPEYREVTDRIKQGATSWTCKSDADVSFQWSNEPDAIILREPNGNSSSRREGGHRVKLNRMCRYFQASWLYRCNIYDLDFKLTSMKATRGKFKKLQKSANDLPVENPILEISPQTPKMHESPDLRSLRGGSGGQNKEDKNDNPENVGTEPSLFAPGGSEWEKLKAQLKAKQDERRNKRYQWLETLQRPD